MSKQYKVIHCTINGREVEQAVDQPKRRRITA